MFNWSVKSSHFTYESADKDRNFIRSQDENAKVKVRYRYRAGGRDVYDVVTGVEAKKKEEKAETVEVLEQE